MNEHATHNGKSSSSKSSDDAERVPYGGYTFVDIHLRERDKDNFKEWVTGDVDLMGWVDSLLAAGCKLSITLDSHNGGVLATATQRLRSSPDAGAILTARHRDTHLALLTLMFKDVAIAQERTWRECNARRGGPGEEQA